MTRSGLFLDSSGGKERQPGFEVGVCKQIWRRQKHIENTLRDLERETLSNFFWLMIWMPYSF